MGLAERRAIDSVKDGSFFSFKYTVQNLVGKPIEVSVNWDQMKIESLGSFPDRMIERVFFEPVIEALKSVGSDFAGKASLQKNLKAIQIQNTSQSPYATDSLKDGVLILDQDPTKSLGRWDERRKDLTRLLEKSL